MFAWLGVFGRLSMWIAGWFEQPCKGRVRLSSYCEFGFVSPKAQIAHHQLILGHQIFLSDGVVICEERYGSNNAGRVHLGERVQLFRDVIIETGANGAVSIGDESHVQLRCQFAGFHSEIRIGCRVDIASNCVFYPYDHQTLPERRIRRQPLTSKGPIILGDDVWFGTGVILLAGITIGDGAVVGAGSVVTKSIPAGAIAVGSPEKVIRMRSDIAPPRTGDE